MGLGTPASVGGRQAPDASKCPGDRLDAADGRTCTRRCCMWALGAAPSPSLWPIRPASQRASELRSRSTGRTARRKRHRARGDDSGRRGSRAGARSCGRRRLSGRGAEVPGERGEGERTGVGMLASRRHVHSVSKAGERLDRAAPRQIACLIAALLSKRTARLELEGEGGHAVDEQDEDLADGPADEHVAVGVTPRQRPNFHGERRDGAEAAAQSLSQSATHVERARTSSRP